MKGRWKKLRGERLDPYPCCSDTIIKLEKRRTIKWRRKGKREGDTK